MLKILVTGANGFIGSQVVKTSLQFGLNPVSQTRKSYIELPNNVVVDGLTEETSWLMAWKGLNVWFIVQH